MAAIAEHGDRSAERLEAQIAQCTTFIPERFAHIVPKTPLVILLLLQRCLQVSSSLLQGIAGSLIFGSL